MIKTIIKKFPKGPTYVRFAGTEYSWVVITYCDEFPPCVVQVFHSYDSAKTTRGEWLNRKYNQIDPMFRNQICNILGVKDLNELIKPL